MLPQGALADLCGSLDQQVLKSLHPDAQTAARLLVGRCSCDFVRPRLEEPREDERHLRERYRRLEVPRPRVIAALERHRRGAGLHQPAEGWPRALAKFVAEHARNAGPTLYLLHFSSEASHLTQPGESRRVPLAQVLAAPESWLLEGSPTLVSR